MASRALALNACARTVRACDTVPLPRHLRRPRFGTSPRARSSSGPTLEPAGKASSWPTLKTMYAVRENGRKPRFGKRRCSGIWPPSYPGGLFPPEREPRPLCPRPAVLPLPEPGPRPTRLRRRVEPGAGWRWPRSMPSALRLDQVGDLGEHAAHRGRILQDDGLAAPGEPQAAQGGALARARADLAAAQRGLHHSFTHVAHASDSLSAAPSGARSSAQLPDRLSAQRRHLIGRSQLSQGSHGGAHHVVRIVRSDALGEHVGEARQLDDRAHAASGDDARAVGRGLQQDLARTEPAGDLEGNRALDEGHVEHALLGLLDALADRLWHLLRLAEPESHPPGAVADDYEGAEAEAPAALHDLRHAVDVHDLLFQLGAAVVDDPPLAAGSHLRHVFRPLWRTSELEAALAGALCHRAYAAVIEEPVAVEDHPGDALLLAPPGGEQPDLLGGGDVRSLRQLGPQLRGEGGHREERLARLVGDHLDVHVPIAPKHGEPRPLVGAAHTTADPIATALPRFPARCRHQRAPAAAFPAFRRMVSVPYLTPLPL